MLIFLLSELYHCPAWEANLRDMVLFLLCPSRLNFARSMAQDEILKLTLSLIQTFKSRETENNWNETSNIIKEISNNLRSNDLITVIELDRHLGQIMSVIEKTVIDNLKIYH